VPNDSGLHELNVERDGDFIPDENPSSFKGCVPGQAIIFATDFGSGRKSQARVPPGVFRRRSRSFYSKDNLARDSMNGQIASDGEFVIGLSSNACRFEGQRGEFLCLEEIGTLQVGVPLFIPRMDGGSLD